uniref:Uncharacterized protein n=1 Tax=Amphimedon queenslandica TaxID=400682 RepID=A0A1X7V6T2_AMPQE
QNINAFKSCTYPIAAGLSSRPPPPPLFSSKQKDLFAVSHLPSGAPRFQPPVLLY